MKALFNTGRQVATEEVFECMAVNTRFSLFCQEALQRHIEGDWGDLEQADTEWNIEALKADERIFSRYIIPEDMNIKADTKIYIITEGDRSLTTILFSSEY